ncbi:uncharacterized protein LOC109727153 isoform X2 [Ananas comosus]|uniref:Uncharacterized protein LOC109727153 isoform X2 n=1 Tax=Ananas comosus TaxID=4615 RepID=A0A6P5GXU5_ANACO|nr:uncharacterized protein LOC109727153 isoform X2 [Ananas comosus]
MKPSTSFGFIALLMALVLLATMKIQYEHLKMDLQRYSSTASPRVLRSELEGLPRGIVEATSDMDLKPLSKISRSKDRSNNYSALLAMAVGISQKENVDRIVSKFLMENFAVILFHYDGNVDGWHDLEWSNKAIHILARSQTKWWFAKRFLHPDVVSVYDYIFLWDEDLGVENFHPGRYLEIMSSEELEISQPALDPELSSDIHHRITVRNKLVKVHRRVYGLRGSVNCTDESKGPPCTGWVEGMAPVFSRAAWRCVWHLIQNDLIHGWGLDMKLGYCAQGDRTRKVGVIDSEYVVHQGIPSLGGLSVRKERGRPMDLRIQIRRQSTAELKKFKERWNQAVREDDEWTDPFDDFARENV